LTSIIAITCLRAQTGVGPQVTSHVFGLLKADKEDEDIQGSAWLVGEEGAKWVLESTDAFVEVFKGTGESDTSEENVVTKSKL
jgi:hypothetical protein